MTTKLLGISALALLLSAGVANAQTTTVDTTGATGVTTTAAPTTGTTATAPAAPNTGEGGNAAANELALAASAAIAVGAAAYALRRRTA